MAKREEIRQAVEQLGPRGRGRPYPKALRDEITAYVGERRAAGKSIVEIGGELGVSWRTFSRWVEPSRRRKAFRPIQVVEQRASFVVHGPRGLRIEGLDFDGLAELVRRLG